MLIKIGRRLRRAVALPGDADTSRYMPGAADSGAVTTPAGDVHQVPIRLTLRREDGWQVQVLLAPDEAQRLGQRLVNAGGATDQEHTMADTYRITHRAGRYALRAGDMQTQLAKAAGWRWHDRCGVSCSACVVGVPLRWWWTDSPDQVAALLVAAVGLGVDQDQVEFGDPQAEATVRAAAAPQVARAQQQQLDLPALAPVAAAAAAAPGRDYRRAAAADTDD